ncbi:hypothetical protein BV96_00611 [Sphingomonas paucimobilis]|nr:hypothetical protein BV96_00611 [Sphingomonas paucimobilis]
MRLFVHDIRLEAQIGALSSERGRFQPLIIDIDAVIVPPQSDRMEDAVDYRGLLQRTTATLDEHIVLIETAASRVADACMRIPGIAEVSVTVRKPGALAPAMAGVTVTRSDGG